MGFGKLVYKLFFKPTLFVRYNLSHFGLIGWYKMYNGERKMKAAAASAPAIKLSTAANAIVFCFLTGDRYWHQTVFAIKSLHLQMPGQFGVNIYSDGTLTDGQLEKLKRFAPGIVYVSPTDVEQRLNKVLPVTEFPNLRFFRNWHPFFKRMIDIHTSPGWAIHLDSDMLFLEAPSELVNAYLFKQAIYMQDEMDSSYFVDTVETLNQNYSINCSRNVNGGIVAYNNDLIDYADLESKAKVLKDNYLHTGAARIEQTLMSYILCNQNAKALNNNYAIFFDSELTDKADQQVVRHFIFEAKLPYFDSEWRSVC